MANQNKMGNLLKFTEYDQLQPKQSPTKYTEVGGFAIFEQLSVINMLERASKKTGKSIEELRKLPLLKIEEILGYYKKPFRETTERDTRYRNEDFVDERNKILESSAKQKAARKKFMEMIAKKKDSKENKNNIKPLREGPTKANVKHYKGGEVKKGSPPPPVRIKK